jgi:hypothetical protein
MGVELMAIAPPTPQAAIDFATKFYKDIEQQNGLYLADYVPPGEDEDFDRTEFGHYLAMEGMGHGVGWSDDHEDHGLQMTQYAGEETDLAYDGDPELSQLADKLIETYGTEHDWYEGNEYKGPEKGYRTYSRQAQDRKSFDGGFVILKGCVDGDGIQLDDDTPVNVGVVHDGSGYTPGAAVYVMQNQFHGGDDAVLQAAYEILEEHTFEDMSPEEMNEMWETEEKEGYNPVTESFDGWAFSVSPTELAEMIISTEGINREELDVIDFYEDNDEVDPSVVHMAHRLNPDKKW